MSWDNLDKIASIVLISYPINGTEWCQVLQFMGQFAIHIGYCTVIHVTMVVGRLMQERGGSVGVEKKTGGNDVGKQRLMANNTLQIN